MRSLTLVALFLANSAFALPFVYQCYPTEESGTAEKMNVLIKSATTATIEGHHVRLDPKYKPKKNLSYVRFDGDVDWLNADGWTVDLLFNRTMLKGVTRTSMKVMARGESFYNDYYNCWRRN